MIAVEPRVPKGARGFDHGAENGKKRKIT